MTTHESTVTASPAALAVGDRVIVAHAATIRHIRSDADGNAYEVRNDHGYGVSVAKTAAGDTIVPLADPARTIDVEEAATADINLLDLLDKAAEQGEAVVLTRDGDPLVAFVPLRRAS
jgi:hypothetical protein